MNLTLRAFAPAALLLAHQVPAQSVWHVDATAAGPGTGTPGDPYSSIQYAVDQQSTLNNDELLIAPGTYIENLDLAQKSLRLFGVAGASRTVLRAAGPGHLVSGIRNGSWSFEGLSFTGTTGLTDAALFIELSSDVRVEDCVIAGNAGYGVLNAYDLDVVHSTFTGNRVAIELILLSTLDIWNSIVWGNQVGLVLSPFSSVASCCLEYSEPLCPNCIIADPLFWDDVHGDYFLLPGSRCIGSGSQGADIGAFDFDPIHRPDLETFCVTAPNSVGPGARINATGSTSLTGGQLSLTVTAATPNQFGVYFYGEQPTQSPLGDGSLCIGAGTAGLFRLMPAILFDASGENVTDLDFGSPALASGPGALIAGSTWHFQCWYRDPLGPGGSGSNLTDGLRARFWP